MEVTVGLIQSAQDSTVSINKATEASQEHYIFYIQSVHFTLLLVICSVAITDTSKEILSCSWIHVKSNGDINWGRIRIFFVFVVKKLNYKCPTKQQEPSVAVSNSDRC